MAKEVDLKRIELKVSANCCEGCKRKVRKALRGIEGVLKTEIDPLQPKVRILGNVNPQILIKKLLKVGKHAELSGYEELKSVKKEAETIAVAKEKEKPNINGYSQEKQSNICDIKIEKIKDTKMDNNNMTSKASIPPQDLKKEIHHMPQEETNSTYSNVKSHPQYYAMPSYLATSLPPTCVEVHYHYRPTWQVEDYFSDDNSVGCHVM